MGHVFCRKALRRISTKVIGVDQDAFTVNETTSMNYTVNGPDEFVWHGQACCEWYAKE